MTFRHSLLCAAALAAASLAPSLAAAAGADHRPAITPPPRPDVNVRIVVHPGIPADRLPEKAHGYLTRKGAGKGQREGSDDPGPPQGESGDGTGKPPGTPSPGASPRN
jgi:hypothetical protein